MNEEEFEVLDKAVKPSNDQVYTSYEADQTPSTNMSLRGPTTSEIETESGHHLEEEKSPYANASAASEGSKNYSNDSPLPPKDLGIQFARVQVEEEHADKPRIEHVGAEQVYSELTQNLVIRLQAELANTPNMSLSKLQVQARESLSGGGRKPPKFLKNMLNIGNIEDYAVLMKGLADENLNNKFINLSLSIILLLPKISSQLEKAFTDLVLREQDPDLIHYVAYLRQAEDASFQIGSIDNPRIPRVAKPSRFNLLRLAHTKLQLCKVLIILIEGLCDRRSYSNTFQVPVEPSNPTLFRDYGFMTTPKKPASCQNMEISSFARAEFLAYHQVKMMTNEGFVSCGAAKDVGFDITHCSPHFTHVFSPLKEMTWPMADAGLPLIYHSATKGCVKVTEGKMTVYDSLTKNTKIEKAEKLLNMHKYLFPNINSPNTKLLWMQEIGVKIFLNNRSSKEGSLFAQVAYRVWETNREPKDCLTLAKDDSMNINRASTFKNFAASKFKESAIRDDEVLYRAVTNCFNNRQSFIVEPLVIVQHLLETDDWSLYLQWDAIEASPLIAAMYGVANYLQTVARKSETTEFRKLIEEHHDKDAIKVGQALGIKEALESALWCEK